MYINSEDQYGKELQSLWLDSKANVEGSFTGLFDVSSIKLIDSYSYVNKLKYTCMYI